MILFAWLVVLLFGAGLLHLMGQPQKTKPPKELLSFEPQGFIFGEYRRAFQKPQYFFKSEQTDGHILIVGGPGSGKSSGLAIPSLLAWRSSIFAIDIKGELSAATANKPGQRKVFNPMRESSWGYDPYCLLRQSDNPAQEAMEIAQTILPIPPDIKDPHWIDSARNMLMGFMLHDCHEGASFIDTMTNIVSRPVEMHIKYIYDCTQSEDARYFLNGFIGMEAKRLADYYTEIANKIMVFATDKNIRQAFNSTRNISPQDLEDGCDIYLNIPEDKLDQWSVPVNLIVRKFLKHFERRPDNNAAPILFLLDEFPRLGKIEATSKALGTLRSKKVVMCIVIQSPAQLDMVYGHATCRVIMGNCTFKAVLEASDAESQETFSRLVGTQRVVQQGSSTSYAPDHEEERGHTVSSHDTDRRIIQPHEFATLKDVVLLTPWGCYRAGKIRPT